MKKVELVEHILTNGWNEDLSKEDLGLMTVSALQGIVNDNTEPEVDLKETQEYEVKKNWLCEIVGRALDLKVGDTVELNAFEYDTLRGQGVV